MEFYAGLDVSLESTSMCVVNGEGKVVREGKLPSDPDAIELFLAEWASISSGRSKLHTLRIDLQTTDF